MTVTHNAAYVKRVGHLGNGRSGGAAALRQAEVICPQTFQALEVTRCQVRAQVRAMIKLGH
ncbi:hypothetical protein F475_03688 [Pseudomonas sp. URMO17WK12:I6]|nr:hypothetical protein F475_03688 [Pseudomonas sp. URMO17WK12:I6]